MIGAPFYLRSEPSESVRKLLHQTVLGNNGARYQHLQTAEILPQLDDPQFLSLERHGKALANVTFCRRNGHWYIRYFAVEEGYRAKRKGHQPEKGNSLFKKGVETFFKTQLENGVQSFYAYVDPNNDRSRWMCENFGFKPIGQLVTQSFSRKKPVRDPAFEILQNQDEINTQLARFSDYAYTLHEHAPRSKYGVIRSENGEIQAFVKYQHAHWRIERLPGKMGGILQRMIPFIPGLSGVFNPNDHHFLVPEAVYVNQQDAGVLTRLLSSILAHEGQRLLLWWMDAREPLWQQTRKQVPWGIMHRVLGNPPVTVYARFPEGVDPEPEKRLLYVSAMDLI